MEKNEPNTFHMTKDSCCSNCTSCRVEIDFYGERWCMRNKVFTKPNYIFGFFERGTIHGKHPDD